MTVKTQHYTSSNPNPMVRESNIQLFSPVDIQPLRRERVSGNTNSKQSFHFYSDLSSAKSLDEFKEKLAAALEQLGFSEYVFSAVGCESSGNISTAPQELFDTYEQQGYQQYDLVAKHAENQTGAVYSSAVTAYVANSPLHLDSNVKYLELCEMMASFDFLDAYNIPFRTPMGVNCLFSVTCKGISAEQLAAKVETCKPLLHMLGDIVTVLAIAKYAAFFFGHRALSNRICATPKQLELLERLAKSNVTLQGAANEMHISLDTANKHIAAIKHALGAKTQATAVYRAIVSGLIKVDSECWTEH